MKGLSWDKFRRLMGGRKKDELETDSSKFQRSYSFKRASVRKSGRRVAVAGGLAKGQCSSKNANGVVASRLRQESHLQHQQVVVSGVSAQGTRRESFDYDANFNVETVAGLHPAVLSDEEEEVDGRYSRSHNYAKHYACRGGVAKKQQQYKNGKAGDGRGGMYEANGQCDIRSVNENFQIANYRGVVEEEFEDKDWTPMMRVPEVVQNIGRRQRAENIRRLMREDFEEDSEWVDFDYGRSSSDSKNQLELRSGCKSNNGHDDKLRRNAHIKRGERNEDDVEIVGDEFYLSMLPESPKPLRRSTDSALSHLTLESSGASNSSLRRSDYSPGNSNGIQHGESRTNLNTSSLESASIALVGKSVETSEKSLPTIVHKSERSASTSSNLKYDSDKYNDDVTLDKNLSLLDSGCYNYNSGKLSINASSASGGTSSGSFPKEMDSQNSSGGRTLDPSRERDFLPISLKTDEHETPRSFWWSQKPGSTMTTSSGASRDSGFSLGRSWAWGIASRMFGKGNSKGIRGGHKGPILSVSKEGYFQRTNLRRASSRRHTYALRSSVAKRSSAKLRRSGRRRKISQNPMGSSSSSGPLVGGDPYSSVVLMSGPISPMIPFDHVVCNSDYIDVQNSCQPVYQHCINVRNRLLPIDPFIFVPPEKRRSRRPDLAARFRGASEIRFPFPGGVENQNEQQIETHRFESLDIRLPRLRCESRSENDVVITKVIKSEAAEGVACKSSNSENRECITRNSPSAVDTIENEEINDEDNENDYEDTNASDGDSDTLPYDKEEMLKVRGNSGSGSQRSSSNEKENLIPMKRRPSSRKKKAVKVITKPSAMAVYRRHSTLYRRGKLGPDFALPRPNVKTGEIHDNFSFCNSAFSSYSKL